MRLHLRTTPSNSVIQFNYQPMLTGVLHKWLGKNSVHDSLSFYSFSWLKGGEATKGGLHFQNGAYFFISAFDARILSQIVNGIKEAPEIANGLVVREIFIQDDPEFTKQCTFLFASPILVKRRIEEREVHFKFDDEQSDGYLTDTLKRKLRKAGLSDETVSVSFDKTYHSPRTKIIYYKKVGNKVNLCPVKITGDPEQIAFAWNVGIGNSTGIGFGAVK